MKTAFFTTLAILVASSFCSVALADSGAGDASPNATPTLSGKSAADESVHGPSKLKVSVALERVGGFSYTRASAKDTSDSGSLTAFQIGGVSANPYSAPRLGVDLILESNLTLGAGLSIGRYSLSSTSGSTTQDIGSLFIYTLTPRVGYRFAASPDFDVTPRAGLTLAGGSVTDGSNNGGSSGVFALALAGEVVGAYRATQSFNLLAGLSFDDTVSASASSTSSSGSSSSSQDIKGGLYALQLWLGVGGYL